MLKKGTNLKLFKYFNRVIQALQIMKTIIYIIIGAVLSIIVSCSSSGAVVLNDNTAESGYTIQKITKDHSYYIIYATKNDSTFLIVSERSFTDKHHHNKHIKIGKTYPIGLVPIYPKESLLNIKTTPQLGVKYITISDEVTIKLDEKTHNTIYYSPDLVGITIR